MTFLRQVARRALLPLAIFTILAGCSKKSSKASVVAKEYIPAHVEGTEYKEREMAHEQWLVEIQLESGAKTKAPVDEAQWRALKVGDQVRAKYSQGDYTGTIWDIEIEKR